MQRTAATTRERRAPQERRMLLLDAAITAITVRGFDGVTVRDVAKQANVSTGLVHHYFESFPQMLAEAFAREARGDIERLTAAAAAATEPRARLDRLVALYAPREDDPGWFIWFSAWGAAQRQPQLRETAAQLHGEWMRQFTLVLSEGAASGGFSCAQPPAATRRIISLLDGLATQVVALRSFQAHEVAGDIAVAVANETGLAPDDFPEILRIGSRPALK